MIHIHNGGKRAPLKKEGLLLHGGRERKVWKVALEFDLKEEKRERFRS